MEDKIICLDLDDTLANYEGWRNEGYTTITSQPVDGAKEGVEELRRDGYYVRVHSARCAYPGGVEAVEVWLTKHGIVVDEVCVNKPFAICYVDDKGICFRGDWKQTVEDIKNFKHWKPGRK